MLIILYMSNFVPILCLCMIKIFWGEGRGGDTFKTPSPYEQLLPLPTPCFKMFLEDPLMTPHHPTSSIFHCYPLPIHHPSPPPKNFGHTLSCNLSSFYFDRGQLRTAFALRLISSISCNVQTSLQLAQVFEFHNKN